MITRVYRTVEECTRLWVCDSMNNIEDTFVLNQQDFFEHWEFVELDDDGDLMPTHEPMWGTYFEFADPCDLRWAEQHEREIAAIGFTLIYRDGDLWGLGVDGAGYDFYDAHWIPLYRLRGFRWHQETA